MSNQIPASMLETLSELIVARTGLHFPAHRHRDLSQRIRYAAKDLGFDDEEQCCSWLIDSLLTSEQVDSLADHLTTGETYFFRNAEVMNSLENEILPNLIAARRTTGRRLRIWSAGCSTGEEPYSLAILLHKMLWDLDQWHITILATDINRTALQKAMVGVYKEWSFRSTPSWVKNDYFAPVEDRFYEIAPQVKDLVTFKPLNLVTEYYPSQATNTHEMDLIFCRNVLMYFDEERQKQVVGHLYEALTEGGWLVVSPSEASHLLFAQFRAVNKPGAILYQKANGQEPQNTTFPSPALYEWAAPPLFSEPEQKEPLFSESYLPDLVGDAEPEPPPMPTPVDQVAGQPVLTSVPEPLTVDRARALFAEGRYEKLVQQLAGEPSLDDPQLGALAARACANLGRLDQALAWCERAILGDRFNAQFYWLQATILQELGHLQEAKIHLRKALYLDPNFVLAYFTMANLHATLGEKVNAERCFRNAANLVADWPPDEPVPHSEGLTVGSMMDLISVLTNQERKR